VSPHEGVVRRIHENQIFDKETAPMNVKHVVYWATTAVLAFALFSGAIGELTRQWGTLETVTILGYPAYFLSIIGLWKIAGAVTLLVPRFPRLKEWAYAGIFLNMTGAFASHAAVGDFGTNAYHLFATGSLVLLAIASWALRPPSRVLRQADAAEAPRSAVRAVRPASAYGR
jgi:uncharacterized membrane protein YphA (DoxX/SURF4 family)